MSLLEKFSLDLTARKEKIRSLIKGSYSTLLLCLTMTMNSGRTFPFENERINSSGHLIAKIMGA
jgi:hypothetical protein